MCFKKGRLSAVCLVETNQLGSYLKRNEFWTVSDQGTSFALRQKEDSIQ